MLKKKSLKKIALLLFSVMISIPLVNSVSAIENSKQNMENIELIDIENDIFAQNLTETIEIEGIYYNYKYYYNTNGLKSVSITNLLNSNVDILTFDEGNTTIYLNGQEIAYTNTEYDCYSNDEKSSEWTLIAGPAHLKITWKAGATVSVVSTLIAGALSVPASAIVQALGSGLTYLASKAEGGTLHFSKYYRDLALGQVQYKTDWSFVACTGKRLGTYDYYSTPQ